ncbi:MAG: excinuclease ABC subunit UvrA [Pseudomonadota bacterium]|nr:excinuclease ABC subunit UvrA [Pseudomonadota bacterium]
MAEIKIKGAKTHNLKNIDVIIPRNKLTVITGLSGSGKSSLAFDTLYAEGQRRYVESLSAYARQFLSMMEKPELDHISGLSPAIAIEQKNTSHNPRSTVGTITEIYDYLRLLFARAGVPRCPKHHDELKAQTISQICDKIMCLEENTKITINAPIVQNRKGEHGLLFEKLIKQGFTRFKVNGKVEEYNLAPALDSKLKHNIEVVVDRIKVKPGIEQRLAESVETTAELADGIVLINFFSEKEEPLLLSTKHACAKCGYSVPRLEPRMFSFNSPQGACSECDGLGSTRFFDPEKVIIDSSLSIAGGAIKGWDKRHDYYYQVMQALAYELEFDLNTPWQNLPDNVKKVILYGSGRTRISFSYRNRFGKNVVKSKKFEGVIPNLDRRYAETESDAVREELTKYLTYSTCPKCNGSRLSEVARNVFIGNKNIPSLSEIPIDEALDFFQKLELSGNQLEIATPILTEIKTRMEFLLSVGLNYLSLHRSAETLSGGEAQRIRLASQIGSGLVGVMYVLDEPSIGLHQRDNDRLLNTLKTLRNLGNSVIVVEHDEDAILTADHVIDIGPGAGVHGGEIVATGTPKEIMRSKRSLTGKYLSGKEKIEIPPERLRYDPARMLRIVEAECNNLKKVNANIPLGLMTCVTGVSGSGKSSLINDTLLPVAEHKLNRAKTKLSGKCKDILGLQMLDKVVAIDQSPIGRTPRSNPATYTGIFTPIRELLSQTEDARVRGYKPGRFSFNVPGGRCEACQGDGLVKVEMHFLADVFVTCDVCQGKRYNRETLTITYKKKNIADILNMNVEEAAEFFSAIPVISRKLQTLIDVGLGYISLGQSATTLSGGEAQRIKLAKELSKRSTGNTLYILDEPTTGLHFHDVKKLIEVLFALRNQGNTIVIIEHNLDVIKTCDWIIDIGPEGGKGGGNIVASGPPEKIVNCEKSYTAQFLKPLLAKQKETLE